MNLADAQAATRRDSKSKCAVAVSGKKAVVGSGITDDPDVEVYLFTLIREGEADLKARKEALEAEGYKVTYGTLARGILILERGDDACSMSLVKRPAKITRSGDGQNDA